MINDEDLPELTSKKNTFIIYKRKKKFHFILDIHCYVGLSQNLTCFKIL